MAISSIQPVGAYRTMLGVLSRVGVLRLVGILGSLLLAICYDPYNYHFPLKSYHARAGTWSQLNNYLIDGNQQAWKPDSHFGPNGSGGGAFDLAYTRGISKRRWKTIGLFSTGTMGTFSNDCFFANHMDSLF